MRAEIIGLAAGFDVPLELQPDGSWKPPALLTLSLRKCWRKPPVKLKLAYLHTHSNIAYYVEESLNADERRKGTD